MAYTVTFWGTRGSIPTPGAHTARYGGNTPCVAVEGSGGGKGGRGGQLVILDAGTGIRALGRELVERQNGAVQAEILLSHAHLDHIQGLPHFKPFFAPGNAVRIWGSRQGTTSLEAILRQQMDPAVFPVPLDALSAKLTVQQVEPGEFTVGTFRVQAMRLRHPGTTLGYRLTPAAGGPSMAYVTDNELGPGGHYETPASWRKDFVMFLQGVELLIHDAMYTPEELEEHRGWGHSTFEEAVALAGDAGVKRLVLFHHEPEHGDEAIDALLAAARRQARAKGLPAEVVAAGGREQRDTDSLIEEPILCVLASSHWFHSRCSAASDVTWARRAAARIPDRASPCCRSTTAARTGRTRRTSTRCRRASPACSSRSSPPIRRPAWSSARRSRSCSPSRALVHRAR